jgi:hypothetical protein
MLVKERNNTPVSAVEIHDLSSLLSDFRSFSGNPEATISDFSKFMAVNSYERQRFISLFQLDFTVENNSFVIQKIIQ